MTRCTVLLLLRAPFLLAGCSPLIPPEPGCVLVAGGQSGEIVAVDGSTEPAFECDPFWECESSSYYNGQRYAVGSVHELVETAPGSARQSDEELDATAELWCDRCRWADERPPLILGGSWADLFGECAWW